MTNVFTYTHSDGREYVLENNPFNKPHKVRGRVEEILDMEFPKNTKPGDIFVQLHFKRTGPFVRIIPIAEQLEEEILSDYPGVKYRNIDKFQTGDMMSQADIYRIKKMFR